MRKPHRNRRPKRTTRKRERRCRCLECSLPLYRVAALRARRGYAKRHRQISAALRHVKRSALYELLKTVVVMILTASMQAPESVGRSLSDPPVNGASQTAEGAPGVRTSHSYLKQIHLKDDVVFMRILSTVCASMVAALAGCRAFVPVVDIKALPSETQEAVRALPIYNDVQLARVDFRILGIVEGISCKHWMWDPPATREGALEQTKYYAYQLGADGLASVEFGGKEATSVHTNCWEVIRCSAGAIKFERP